MNKPKKNEQKNKKVKIKQNESTWSKMQLLEVKWSKIKVKNNSKAITKAIKRIRSSQNHEKQKKYPKKSEK